MSSNQSQEQPFLDSGSDSVGNLDHTNSAAKRMLPYLLILVAVVLIIASVAVSPYGSTMSTPTPNQSANMSTPTPTIGLNPVIVRTAAPATGVPVPAPSVNSTLTPTYPPTSVTPSLNATPTPTLTPGNYYVTYTVGNQVYYLTFDGRERCIASTEHQIGPASVWNIQPSAFNTSIYTIMNTGGAQEYLMAYVPKVDVGPSCTVDSNSSLCGWQITPNSDGTFTITNNYASKNHTFAWSLSFWLPILTTDGASCSASGAQCSWNLVPVTAN